MISESLAEKASRAKELSLDPFPEFVGLGVVPKRPRSSDMVIAVYVSRPKGELSKAFKSHVPKVVLVKTEGGSVAVPTRIVNVGRLTL